MPPRRFVVALVALALSLGALPALAKEYLLTAVKPNKLVLVDGKARKVERVYEVPGAGPSILTVTPSRDGKRAYVIGNRWESVIGIDLDTGEQVFRADLSSGDVRTKAMFGMDVSPDGKELFVFQSPVTLGLGEYTVGDTFVGVYDTSSGIDAKPVRTFSAPRRTAVLMMSDDGKKLYAANWDITVMDPKTGEVLDTLPVRTWNRPNYSEPDVLDVWPQWEQANVFSTPYFALRTDLAADDPAAYKMGMLTLDLVSGEFAMNDYENFDVIIFSSVVNPVRRNEVYSVYTQLGKIDIEKDELVKRIDLDHTYYVINVAGDGSELYVGGTMNDISVYSTDNLEKLARIEMPGGADQVLASLRVVNR